VSESALTGWLLPIKEGSTCAYVPSPFVTAYEEGAYVFLFDEVDAASPDMLVILNGALANGGFTVPQRFTAPYVRRGDDLSLMGAANTTGGADDSYSARSPIDKATLNRFYPIFWPHDDALESYMMGLPSRQRYWTPQGVTEWTGKDAEWVKSSQAAKAWCATVRGVIERNKLAHVFSSRQSMMYQAALRAGCTHAEVRTDLLHGWGPDEVAKLPESAKPKNAPVVGAEVEGV
jgi:MoxR-like ATPase